MGYFVDGYGRRIYTCKNCGRIFKPSNQRGHTGKPSEYCSRIDCLRARRRAYAQKYRNKKHVEATAKVLQRYLEEGTEEEKQITREWLKKLYRKMNNES